MIVFQIPRKILRAFLRKTWLGAILCFLGGAVYCWLQTPVICPKLGIRFRLLSAFILSNIRVVDKGQNCAADDKGGDDDDDHDMFLRHYIADKVSRDHKTRLSLHNTVLNSWLFIQLVQIYPIILHLFAPAVQISTLCIFSNFMRISSPRWFFVPDLKQSFVFVN